MDFVMPGSYSVRNNDNNDFNSLTSLYRNETSSGYGSTLENRQRILTRTGTSSDGITNNEIINENEYDISKIIPQTANIMKLKNKLRTEAVINVHNLIIVEILLVYLIDTSFIKMFLKIIFEITLMSFAQDKVSQILEFMSAQQNNSISDNEFRETLKKMSKGVSFMMIFLNGIVLMDHVFVFNKFSSEIPHYLSVEAETETLIENGDSKKGLQKLIHLIYVSMIVIVNKVIKYWNADTELSILKYENPDNFNYNALFINFIGELKPSNRVGLIALDLSIVFFQYLLYLQGMNQPDSNSDKDNYDGLKYAENNGYEDGYQGSLAVLNLNLTPCLPYIELRDRVISFFVD